MDWSTLCYIYFVGQILSNSKQKHLLTDNRKFEEISRKIQVHKDKKSTLTTQSWDSQTGNKKNCIFDHLRPWWISRMFEFVVRGHLQTTLTRFCPFLTTFLHLADILFNCCKMKSLYTVDILTEAGAYPQLSTQPKMFWLFSNLYSNLIWSFWVA